MTTFAELGLAAPLLKALAAERYVTPTPIQTQAIPSILSGRDLLGIAQTGTGKTAAFALPILHRLAADRRRPSHRGCRALVLSPTRELASQITESFRIYGRHLKLSSTAVFGGVAATPQIRAMAGGIDILVATPGRLLDHVGQGIIRLDHVEVLVLDEADRMLDMGFIQPIRQIIAALPSARQSLFFSATMPKDVRKLAADLLTDPIEVAVAPSASTVERIEQQVILVESRNKTALLAEMLADETIERALVFTRTKRGADRVNRHLSASGIQAAAIHGNKSQGQREQALAAFRSGRARILVATDIAARGIDVDGITHVINFELPNIAESYVHRIGRTARAGATGVAISFCDVEERVHLRGIETLIRRRLPVKEHRSNRAPDTPSRPTAAVAENRASHGRNQAGKEKAARTPSAAHQTPHDLSRLSFLAPPKSGGSKQGRTDHKGPTRAVIR